MARGSFLKMFQTACSAPLLPLPPGLAARERISINEPLSEQTSESLSQSLSLPSHHPGAAWGPDPMLCRHAPMHGSLNLPKEGEVIVIPLTRTWTLHDAL